MMRKKLICLLMVFLLLFTAGCGAQSKTEKEENGGEKTLTGTLDEVKDFMFVVTDSNGDSYPIAFGDEKPEGLAEQKIGSKVTVTYTGKLSVVDPFDGEVLSVEAAE